MAHQTASKPSSLKVVDRAEHDGDASPAAIQDPIDGAALDKALQEFAAHQRPMMVRADVVRQRAAQEAREIESALNDLGASEQLLERAYETAKRGMLSQREDLEAALAILQHGLIGASTEARD